MKLTVVKSFVAATAMAVGVAQTASADAITDFYKGKQVSFNVGASAGGGFGIYARIFASHFGKYVPGKPTIVVQHMQGSGGVKAANFVYNVAPKDGSVIHMPVSSICENQLLRPKGVRFNCADFNWIGSIADIPVEFGIWHTAGIKSVEDAKKKSVSIGSPSGHSFLYRVPKMMNELLGTKFNIIIGYKGSGGVDLAMERGEVDGRAVSWDSAISRTGHWYKEGKVRSIVQVGPKPVPALTKQGVPRLIDLVKSKKEKSMVEFLYSFMLIGRAVVAPPGAPRAHVAALSAAFDRTMEDKALKEDLAKRKMPLNPTTGAQLQAFINSMNATPKAQLAEIRAVLQPPKSKKTKK
ncbi:MAG: tripartite tricarboxylate transporter substrate-binding protein [Proteobacteria bacterium]|nr:tripartite tricarboxylate transporter substrate-binding protein [Pseudomonadota bacterium]